MATVTGLFAFHKVEFDQSCPNRSPNSTISLYSNRKKDKTRLKSL